MNKISIITVNKNNSKGLLHTITSVIEQAYTNYEYIIIDGCSTDNSLDVISKFKDKIHFWISEPDSGIFDAMNKGILKSTGDYCYFLNSGDTLVSDHTLMNIFAQKSYDAPFINGHQINLIGQEQHRVRALNRKITLFDLYWGTIKHQATFINRNLFSKYGLYDTNLQVTSDWKFFLQTIGINNEQPDFVDQDIVYFQWDGMSTNPKFSAIHEKERTTVLSQCIPQSIRSDYENFHAISNYKYIIDAMKANSILETLIKGLTRLFK